MGKKKESGFDQKMQRIREIADGMQNRQLSLDDSIALYQEAQNLIRECHAYLEEAELKVQQITGNGNLEPVEDF